jgi:hypothetical protein
MWIGNAADARSAASRIEQGFNVVVDLALDEPPAVLPRELIYMRFPINDGAGNDKITLAAAIKTIAMLSELPGLKIAVCCSAGLSRSPAIVAAGIAIAKDRSPEQTLTKMATQNSRYDVSPALWSDISDVCTTSLR